MRICLAYDCLYPYTVGGAERWYRNLAAELVAQGHEVTYLTRRQWTRDQPPDIPGVHVVAVSPAGPLYHEGRRRIRPPLEFGLGVLLHLLRRRHRYDAVHLCAFPYFSLIAARAALAGTRVPIGVDWFEVWSRTYWRDYLGGLGGWAGLVVQRVCARITPRAFTFSELHRRRLREEGMRGPATRLAGLYAGPLDPHPAPGPRPPLVVFAGRHIPEKQAELVPRAVAAAREEVPELRGMVFGDGPRREAVLEAIAAEGAESFVEAPGFVEAGEVESALGAASCHLLPSSREGYGLVVIEAAALGTPTVVLAGPDNAAVELIEEGVNGFVAPGEDDLAAAIVAAHRGGEELRDATAAWFSANADDLSAAKSAREIVASIEAGTAAQRAVSSVRS